LCPWGLRNPRGRKRGQGSGWNSVRGRNRGQYSSLKGSGWGGVSTVLEIASSNIGVNIRIDTRRSEGRKEAVEITLDRKIYLIPLREKGNLANRGHRRGSPKAELDYISRGLKAVSFREKERLETAVKKKGECIEKRSSQPAICASRPKGKLACRSGGGRVILRIKVKEKKRHEQSKPCRCPRANLILGSGVLKGITFEAKKKPAPESKRKNARRPSSMNIARRGPLGGENRTR